jgi:hypothetical protein
MARIGNLPRPRTINLVSATDLVRARLERANRPLLGNHLSGTLMLTKLNTFVTTGFIASPALEMLRLDAFPVWAIVVIVMDVPMRGRILRRVSVVRGNFRHRQKPLLFMPYVYARAVCVAVARPSAQPLSSALEPVPALPARIAGKANLSWIGCRLPCAQFSAGRGERGSARPRLPRNCRSTKHNWFGFDLTGQFLVSQAFTGSLRQHPSKPITVSGFAIVVSERLFVQIAE